MQIDCVVDALTLLTIQFNITNFQIIFQIMNHCAQGGSNDDIFNTPQRGLKQEEDDDVRRPFPRKLSPYYRNKISGRWHGITKNSPKVL